MDHAFGIVSYMDYQIKTHKFSSMFYSLAFAFKYMVHFEQIVVTCVRTESVSFILQMVIQFSGLFVAKTVLYPGNCLCFWQRSVYYVFKLSVMLH